MTDIEFRKHILTSLKLTWSCGYFESLSTRYELVVTIGLWPINFVLDPTRVSLTLPNFSLTFVSFALTSIDCVDEKKIKASSLNMRNPEKDNSAKLA
jgi:hypothetical protein